MAVLISPSACAMSLAQALGEIRTAISTNALQQKQTKYVVNDLVYLIALLRQTVLDLECNSNVVGTQ